MSLVSNNTTEQSLLQNIKQLLQSSRQHLQQSINTAMVQTYWHIGRLIVEHEQQGNKRAIIPQEKQTTFSKV